MKGHFNCRFLPQYSPRSLASSTGTLTKNWEKLSFLKWHSQRNNSTKHNWELSWIQTCRGSLVQSVRPSVRPYARPVLCDGSLTIRDLSAIPTGMIIRKTSSWILQRAELIIASDLTTKSDKTHVFEKMFSVDYGVLHTCRFCSWPKH